MYCNNCGKQLDENSRFCPHCGLKVHQETTEQNVFSAQQISMRILGQIKNKFVRFWKKLNKKQKRAAIIILIILFAGIAYNMSYETTNNTGRTTNKAGRTQQYEAVGLESLLRYPDQYMGKCIQITGYVDAVFFSDCFLLCDVENYLMTISVKGKINGKQPLINDLVTVYGEVGKDTFGDPAITLHQIDYLN